MQSASQPANKRMNFLSLLLCLVVLLPVLEGKRNDHGVGKLRALVKQLHEKYDKPMDRMVPLMSDEAYRFKKHHEDLEKEYQIE